MQIQFHEFGILQQRPDGYQVFGYRMKTDKFIKSLKGPLKMYDDGSVVIPLYVNPHVANEKEWQVIECRLGSNRIAGFYQTIEGGLHVV